MATRVLHLSDIHFPPPTDGLGGKLLSGAVDAIDFLVGRYGQFRGAADKVKASAEFALQQGVDVVICSGDIANFGTLSELEYGLTLLGAFEKLGMPFVWVPGNHDLPFLVRQTSSLQHVYPLSKSIYSPWVKFIGDDVAVVGICTARTQRWPWISCGHLDASQLNELNTLFERDDVRGRFVFVVTHFGVYKTDGTFDDDALNGFPHGKQLTELCQKLSRGAILHGHTHQCYQITPERPLFPTFCAGSLSQANHESAWLFDVESGVLHAQRVRWQHGLFHT